ncbi:MAG: dihydroorotate dehydrogenase electron transfer subunit [Nanoarchaeota archaeon]|nr:dihydroorotate dehydrogenase electron transfer subunit [Nanoarchaeota archaeon]
MECKELMKSDMPTVLPISKAIREGKDQITIFLKHKDTRKSVRGDERSEFVRNSRIFGATFGGNIKPGQFYMLWIPRIDSKPYAVAYHNNNELGFTSIVIGKFSNAFDKLKVGDKIGLFGPYGNSFSIKDNACVVAGGIGISSVSTLIDKLKNPTIIYGVRKKEYLIYLKRYKKKNMMITTDDGSYGRKAFTTNILKELLKNNKKIKIVYTCGPEIMMKKVLDLCNKYKVECEASVERYMSCGFGICGKCMINDKIICIDGPVFNSKHLNKMTEFGKFARIKSCKKVTIEEYHSTHL